MIHLNIRSLLPKFQLFKEDFLDGDFDIVCLTETWLKSGIPKSLISSVNYNIVRQEPTITNSVTGLCKTGGGIVVFLKSGITYEICESNCTCTVGIELCVIKLSYSGNKNQILIVAYRPPSGNVTNAINTLTCVAERVNDKFNNTEYVILGDLYINHQNKKCCHVKLLKGLEKQLSLTQIIETPTGVTLEKETLIDLCLTNMKNISCCGTVPYFLSDHFPIFVIKKKKKMKKKRCNFTGRCYKNYSLEALEARIRMVKWHLVLQEKTLTNNGTL